MTGIIINLPYVKILDVNGDPVAGADVYFYDAGTTDLRDIFSDAALTIQHPNPLITDAAGDLPLVYIDPNGGSYKMRVVYDAVDVSYDDLAPGVSVPVSIAQGGTGATTEGDARANLGNVPSGLDFTALSDDVADLQVFAGSPMAQPATDLPPGATITPDYSNSNNVQVIEIDQNILAINKPTGIKDGMLGRLYLVNDALGGREVTFTSEWNFPAGNPKLSEQANAVNVVCFYTFSDLSIVSWVERYGSSENRAGPDVLVVERANQGVSSPAGSSSTSFKNRVFNAVRYNRGSVAELIGTGVRLKAGTYYIEANTVVYNSGEVAIRVYDDDNNTTLFTGLSVRDPVGSGNGQVMAQACGFVTLTVDTLIQVQNACESAGTMGEAANKDEEVYAQFKAWVT